MYQLYVCTSCMSYLDVLVVRTSYVGAGVTAEMVETAVMAESAKMGLSQSH